jgi:GTP-dependent phosphoenolpyruvate carboxykinase
VGRPLDLVGAPVERSLNWLLHAGGGFWVGFWGGMAALICWLAWMAKRQEHHDQGYR